MADGMTKYVVQRLRRGETNGTWEDINVVHVPARTKRKTILENALTGDDRQAGTYRVVDEECARPLIVEFEEQPPRLKIG